MSGLLVQEYKQSKAEVERLTGLSERIVGDYCGLEGRVALGKVEKELRFLDLTRGQLRTKYKGVSGRLACALARRELNDANAVADKLGTDYEGLRGTRAEFKIRSRQKELEDRRRRVEEESRKHFEQLDELAAVDSELAALAAKLAAIQTVYMGETGKAASDLVYGQKADLEDVLKNIVDGYKGLDGLAAEQALDADRAELLSVREGLLLSYNGHLGHTAMKIVRRDLLQATTALKELSKALRLKAKRVSLKIAGPRVEDFSPKDFVATLAAKVGTDPNNIILERVVPGGLA
jgi:hypothetical protein